MIFRYIYIQENNIRNTIKESFGFEQNLLQGADNM